MIEPPAFEPGEAAPFLRAERGGVEASAAEQGVERGEPHPLIEQQKPRHAKPGGGILIRDAKPPAETAPGAEHLPDHLADRPPVRSPDIAPVAEIMGGPGIGGALPASGDGIDEFDGGGKPRRGGHRRRGARSGGARRGVIAREDARR